MEKGECGTDQRLIAAIRDFDWPCEKRKPHAPHRETWTVSVHGCGGVQEICDQTCPVPEEQVLDCPGVRAHPAVMIGRANGA